MCRKRWSVDISQYVDISILIPTYNSQPFLGRAISSASNAAADYAARSGSNVEIIVVDDGSVPAVNSRDIDPFRDPSVTIHLVSLPCNRGQEHATNLAVSLARGRLCLLLHGDDMLERDALSTLATPYSNYDSIVMSVAERLEIDARDQLLFDLPPFYNGNYFIEGLSQAKVFLFSGFLPCQVLFKRDAFLRVGGAELGYTINLDGLLWFKLSLEGDVAYQTAKVARYRRHSLSATSAANGSILHLFDWYATTKRMLDYAKIRGLCFEDQRPSIIRRISELAVRFSETTRGDSLHSENRTIDGAELIAIAAEIAHGSESGVLPINALVSKLNEPKKTVSLKYGFYARTVSYAPPVGAVPLSAYGV